MGLPIVATPISTVGLTFEDGTDLVLARDTRAFAAAVVEAWTPIAGSEDGD